MTSDQIMEILRDAREAVSLAVKSRVAAELAAEKAQRAADNAGKEAAEAKTNADIAVKHVIEVRKQILLLAAEEYEERDGARQIGKKRKPEQGSEPEQTVCPCPCVEFRSGHVSSLPGSSLCDGAFFESVRVTRATFFDPEQTVSPDADAPAVKPSSPVEPSPEGPPLMMGEPSPVVEPSPKGPLIPMGPPPMGPAMGLGPPQEGSPVDWPPWDPIGDMLKLRRLQGSSES